MFSKLGMIVKNMSICFLVLNIKASAFENLLRCHTFKIDRVNERRLIGYEGATQPEIITALKAAGVALLADVRAVPLSRRPGFSKNILANGLREAGIDYLGLKALGTPPEGREADQVVSGRVTRLTVAAAA